VIVAALVVAAAVGSATAGCHPTASSTLDRVYGALLGALVAWAAARADRASLLVMTTVGVLLSRSWLLVPAGAALVLAFVAVIPRRRNGWLGCLTGAMAIQVLLRWPPAVFHGLTALVAGLVVALVLISAWTGLSVPHRRWVVRSAVALSGLAVVFSIPVAVTGLTSKDAVDRGTTAARAALDEVDTDDAPGAVTDLEVASADLATARRRTSSWWTAGGALVPVVAQQRRAMIEVTRAGRDLTAAAATEAGSINFHDLAYHDGRIDLTSIQALSRPVEALDAQIATTQALIARSRSAWLVSPIADPLGRFGSELAKARRSADLASLAVKDAPSLLGGSGVRHYFVAFMTPSESRGLDGFIGAFAELTVDQGRVTLARSGPVTQLVAAASQRSPKLEGPADYLYRYSNFLPQDNFEDVTYSPDFPTVEDVIAQLYPQLGGDHIDGVLALDPYALAALLQFTGPISVSGFASQLTSANAAEVLLRGQYLTASSNPAEDARHDLLQEALSVAFAKLASGSLPAPKDLAAALDPEVRQGRLLFWTQHPSDQPLLSRLGLQGAFPQPGKTSDVLAVTVSNSGNNKIDGYLHERLSDRMTYDPADGHVEDDVTIALANDAPSSGLPSYVIGSYPGSGLPPGTNYTWLSVYSPLALTGATSDGRTMAFAAGIPEVGLLAYSAYVTVPAMSTVSIQVELDGDIAAGSVYRDTIRLQPLANPSTVDVSVAPIPGWRPVHGSQASWVPGPDEVQTHSWAFTR
jgi:hypothetical protein